MRDHPMTLKENAVAKYLFDARDELAKVVWPSRAQVVQHSLLVIGLSLVLAAYFGLIDYLLSKGLETSLLLAH